MLINISNKDHETVTSDSICFKIAQKSIVQNTGEPTIPQTPPIDSLHYEFVRLGKERHKITYKLLSLLPKIYKSGIYKEKGFSSIFEYSYKLAGLSESLVKKALKLDEHLENKPCLQKTIETQGIYKVALVAKIATPESDSFFADKVENMSKSALVELSKEIRNKEKLFPQEEPDLKIDLDKESQFLFFKLKKEFGEELSNKQALKEMIRYLSELKFSREKFDRNSKNMKKIPLIKSGRYIPVSIRKNALANTGEKCAHENCNKPYKIFHHIKRFAISKNHDSIIPLCREHHEFAHNGLRENDADSEIDKLFRDYRQKALQNTASP